MLKIGQCLAIRCIPLFRPPDRYEEEMKLGHGIYAKTGKWKRIFYGFISFDVYGVSLCKVRVHTSFIRQEVEHLKNGVSLSR